MKCSKNRFRALWSGGLSEISFLIVFWPLNTIPLSFGPKNPRWRRYQGGSKNRIFYLKNSKLEFFQKVLPRFVVLIRTQISQKSVLENLLKWRRNPRWRIFDFLFSKNCQKSTNKVFFILLKDLCSKIFIFNGKNNVHRVRSKMAAKNQDGGFYFIFLQKFNSNATYHASLKSFFDANQLTIKCCI